MVFTIYCHTCIATGKKYVGQTNKTMEKRWKQHVWDARREGGCLVFGRAIRKWGVECWAHEVLETLASLEEANVAETKWIAHFDCVAPRGYNVDFGGGAKTRNPDTARKIKETRAAKPPEWQAEQTALFRQAHVKWLAESSSEERSEKSRKAWTAITPEERQRLACEREAAKTPEERENTARKIREALAAKTPEERKERSRRNALSRTVEQRRESALKGAAKISPEKRSEIGRKGYVAMLAATTPEQRSALAIENSRKMWASRTPEQRDEIGRKIVMSNKANSTFEERSARATERMLRSWATKTPEQRSEIARRSAATQMANSTPEERSAKASARAKKVWAEKKAKIAETQKIAAFRKNSHTWFKARVVQESTQTGVSVDVEK